MITQENIEEIILNIIRQKVLESRMKFQKITENHKNSIRELEEKWRKLEQFSEKHKEELEQIFPIQDSNTQFLGYRSHLGAVFHDLSRFFDSIEYCMQRDTQEFERYKECVLITYSTFYELTGLNTNSVKKYLSILKKKGKIHTEKFIGGIGYKTFEDKICKSA